MKFKMQQKQNQLIQRISDQHLVVGIDIAQQVHVARSVNFRGIVLGKPISFVNEEDGFKRLLDWINKLLHEHNLNKIIVGMEPTGHYWLNLSKWLKEHNIEVVLVNPHLVKKNKENRDNTQSKSDVKDALVIADMVKNGYYAFTRSNPEIYEKLRIYMSNRDVVIKRLVTTKNQLHRWVEMVFPELQQVFKDITCKAAIATLRLFPTPGEISKLQPDEIVMKWKSIMKRHAGLSKAHFLIEVAKRTVGTKLALNYILSNY